MACERLRRPQDLPTSLRPGHRGSALEAYRRHAGLRRAQRQRAAQPFGSQAPHHRLAARRALLTLGGRACAGRRPARRQARPPEAPRASCRARASCALPAHPRPRRAGRAAGRTVAGPRPPLGSASPTAPPAGGPRGADSREEPGICPGARVAHTRVLLLCTHGACRDAQLGERQACPRTDGLSPLRVMRGHGHHSTSTACTSACVLSCTALCRIDADSDDTKT